MRLEVYNYYIKDVEFSDNTEISNGTLYINKEELIGRINDAFRFNNIKVELIKPGEECRIVRVADIIEPRVKIRGEGQVFPGIISPFKVVGNGKTICLKNVAVVETWQLPHDVKVAIDMSGPAAKLSKFSSTFNLVIIAQPKPNTNESEYAYALKQASLRTAKYLAEAAFNAQADENEVYELAYHGNKDLPRVSYICQFYSIRSLAETLIYGHNGRGIIPTLIHPNEFFDGAIVNNQYGGMHITEVTYTYQNHPVIKELYRRHGKELFFAGVIIKDAPLSINDKERSAFIAAKLAKQHLNAEGIVITKEGGGHPQVDLDLTCRYCEEFNIKSVMLLAEFSSSSGVSDEMTLFNSDTANAIVSCGMEEKIQIPHLKIIGDELSDVHRNHKKEQKISLYSNMDSFRNGGIVTNTVIRGALSQVGETHFSTIEY